MPRSAPSFQDTTETPYLKGSQEQMNRLYTRYRFARDYCREKDVLEVACGAGLGLGSLASVANRVVGGDIDPDNLEIARETYQGRPNLEILQIDAQSLPFPDRQFDVVILYEAIYYLIDPEKFISEAKRVLKSGGILIIGSANKECSGFNPSPNSQRYFSASELYGMLKTAGFNPQLYANCLIDSDSVKSKIIDFTKRTAVKYHLIPKTMKGKEFLKRVFMGKLIPIPSELKDGLAEYIPLVKIQNGQPVDAYKVIFAVGVMNSF